MGQEKVIIRIKGYRVISTNIGYCMCVTNVVNRVLKAVENYPNRPAIELGDDQWTYWELWLAAGRVADSIIKTDCIDGGPVALFSMRSFYTYASILGILRAGRAYLPINSKYPHKRVSRMLHTANCKMAIVAPEYLEYYEGVNAIHEAPLKVIGVDVNGDEVIDESINDVYSYCYNRPSVEIIEPSGYVYILFTSGTTGEPKGIPVSHENLNAYLDYMLDRHMIDSYDRCSQVFDTTFDLSVHDIFVTWSCGACLCPLSSTDLILPHIFIIKKKLTVWYSVPSVAMRMSSAKVLKEACFDSLRYTLFCGEALPNNIAEEWSKAAPNSRIINEYGPSELTISISEHEWDRRISPNISAFGIVPIGKVYNTHRYTVIDAEKRTVVVGEEGELCVSGPQVTDGYLYDEKKTAEVFIELPNEDGIWYRTGDRVRELDNGVLQYIGRTDHQLKVRGYRVEVGEIESLLRSHESVIEAVVVPITSKNGVTENLQAFVLSNNRSDIQGELRYLCRCNLAQYMIPKEINIVEELPLNDNGKIDRKSLINGLKHEKE